MTTVTIPAKLDIWDTCYTITDNGDTIDIKIPCREYGKGSLKEDWSLGFNNWTETNPAVIALIRKMIASGTAGLIAKDGSRFSVPQVLSGLPLAYGWSIDSFK